MPGQLEAGYRQSYDAVPVGIAILDPDLRYIYCNPALAELNGLPAEYHIGKTIRDIVPTVAHEAEAPFREVFRTGAPIRGLKLEGDTERLANFPRTWLENVEPIRNLSGEVSHILVTVEDVTALAETRGNLVQTEAILHASQELNPDGFAILRAVRDGTGKVRDFAWEYANPAAQAFVSAIPLVGQTMSKVVPDAPETAVTLMRHALESGEIAQYCSSAERKGRTIWHQVKVLPVDRDRIAVSYRDVTQNKQAEEQMRLVLAEYRHRLKNVLAVVISLASFSAKSAPDAASLEGTLRHQLVAMGKAQDLVGLLPSQTVDLADLVFAVLKPFSCARLCVEGGRDLQIPSDVAIPLSLLLNELATNAIKHGGLSDEQGNVCLHWSCEGKQLKLAWQEAGCRRPAVEVRQGQGSTLLKAIEQMLPNAKLQCDFLATGARVDLAFDLAFDRGDREAAGSSR